MSEERSNGDLARVVREFGRLEVLVAGDVVADEFVHGEIARVSREAPVMILRYESTETVPGGAGNAAANLAALGARVALVGAVGRDRAGRATLAELRARGVDTSGVVSVKGYVTPTKTRILAGLAHSLRQQVIRVDREPRSALAGDVRARLAERARERALRADAMIVSDYDYQSARAEDLAGALAAASGRNVPTLVDSRFRLADWRGATSATPNESELEAYAGEPLDSDERVEAAGRRAAEELDLDALLVTRGKRGMLLFERGREPLRIAAVGADDAIDVTGAGDTVIAAYALALAAGADFAQAGAVANHAGGLVVMKRGTATVSAEELLASLARRAADGAGEATE